MYTFTEYVSPGHPDKVADFISQYLLDKFIAEDPNTRYAVEVQIKDHYVTLGGEITSQHTLSQSNIDLLVREAITSIGYTQDYQNKWGVNNAISGHLVSVISHISHQSQQIDLGVRQNRGWGDQGVFYGMASPVKRFYYMPAEHAIAKQIAHKLFDIAKVDPDLGLDIKVQLVLSEMKIQRVIVAIPMDTVRMSKAALTDYVTSQVRGIADQYPHVKSGYDITVNGTGEYMQHSSIADCGTTGRKLAVDFYGGAYPLGGGAPWTKDGTKADLTLNLYARYVARRAAIATNHTVFTSLACCIGRPEVYLQVVAPQRLRENRESVLFADYIELPPAALIKQFHLDTPIYASTCLWGLFGEGQQDKAWEQD